MVKHEKELACIAKVINCETSEVFNKIFVEKTDKEVIFYRLNISKNILCMKECNNFGEFIDGIKIPLTKITEEYLLDVFTNIIVKIYDYEEAELLNLDKIACNFTNFLKNREAYLYKNRTNIVKVKYDDYCNCAEVLLNDSLIVSGSYWDFRNNCHGGVFNLLEKFDSYSQLSNILIDKIKMIDKSLKVKLVRERHKLS